MAAMTRKRKTQSARGARCARSRGRRSGAYPRRRLQAAPRELLPVYRRHSVHRPRAHRLTGVVMNRLKLDREALTELRAGEDESRNAVAPGLRRARQDWAETAVVHAWRGDDRSAALELLPALALLRLRATRARSRGSSPIWAHRARSARFGNVATLLRQFAGPVRRGSSFHAARGAAHEDQSVPGAEPHRRA